ncbi:MAG: 8-amino-7-oxononanoate synthase [Gammaproteobacteria bacterium]|nr:8-amino-7-oxononanoate synthase [Gammaproteobacteria bacterium]NND54812.1 8-amino-7-oxononanoate synthase [Gammaproteobacteria bacterium]
MGREIIVDGRPLLNFCSNDYLGLAGDERVGAALAAAARDWGAGAGASHLVCGHTRIHQQLEEALAEFTGRPKALLFSSGYAANVGTINALTGRGDFVLQDKLNHASLLDGGLLSGARFKRYRHRDVGDLESCLSAAGNGRKLVVSDGTFSMDGTVCDVAATSAVTQRHDAWLMLDEAHSLGVSGPDGRGLASAPEFTTADVPVLIGTLGKAFGTQGGFVAGSEELIETLIQHARTYIYSTAIPTAIAAATLTSLELAQNEHWRRDRLQSLIARFRAGASQLGIDLADSHTPIQPVLLGDEQSALAASAALEDRGLLITAIRPPTVPAGTSRLRITLTAAHTDDDVDTLLDALGQVVTSDGNRASA